MTNIIGWSSLWGNFTLLDTIQPGRLEEVAEQEAIKEDNVNNSENEESAATNCVD